MTKLPVGGPAQSSGGCGRCGAVAPSHRGALRRQHFECDPLVVAGAHDSKCPARVNAFGGARKISGSDTA